MKQKQLKKLELKKLKVIVRTTTSKLGCTTYGSCTSGGGSCC